MSNVRGWRRDRPWGLSWRPPGAHRATSARLRTGPAAAAAGVSIGDLLQLAAHAAERRRRQHRVGRLALVVPRVDHDPLARVARVLGDQAAPSWAPAPRWRSRGPRPAAPARRTAPSSARPRSATVQSGATRAGHHDVERLGQQRDRRQQRAAPAPRPRSPAEPVAGHSAPPRFLEAALDRSRPAARPSSSHWRPVGRASGGRPGCRARPCPSPAASAAGRDRCGSAPSGRSAGSSAFSSPQGRRRGSRRSCVVHPHGRRHPAQAHERLVVARGARRAGPCGATIRECPPAVAQIC